MSELLGEGLTGSAKTEDRELKLANGVPTEVSSNKDSAAPSFETPAMPANPPDDWPTYHLIHPGPGRAIPGDPNCAFFWKGKYHLHYIYDHNGFSFAHVSSRDMVHWEWHPTTLTPSFAGHGMFSGTGFLTRDGKPAIIYHGFGSDRNQIAFALDDKLEKWTTPYPVEPKNKDGMVPEMRHWDPDCWLNGDAYYATSGGQNPTLMKSSDLKNWEYIGQLLHDDFPANLGVSRDEDISCGNMFQIGNKWMLLCISHSLGCRYYLGDFKDEKYLPQFHAMMSWNGNNYFAPESLLTKDGRRVMWAWLMDMPVVPTGLQSLPRELEFSGNGQLRIRPLRELEKLRYDAKRISTMSIKGDTAERVEGISGNTIELQVVFQPPQASEFGVDVLTDRNGENGIRIAVFPGSKALRVGSVNAPFELKNGEDITLRVFVDKNIVEVFANDRQAAVSATAYDPENTGVSVFSRGGVTEVVELRCWNMRSIHAVR